MPDNAMLLFFQCRLGLLRCLTDANGKYRCYERMRMPGRHRSDPSPYPCEQARCGTFHNNFTQRKPDHVMSILEYPPKFGERAKGVREENINVIFSTCSANTISHVKT